MALNRGTQWLTLLTGLVLFISGMAALINWVHTGIAIFNSDGTDYTGWVARLVIISFCISGMVLLITSARNLHKL
jgi:hypothetical protein